MWKFLCNVIGLGQRSRLGGASVLAALAIAAHALAFEGLFNQLGTKRQLADVFRSEDAHANVVDGPLLGTGEERTVVLNDGRIRVEQTREYTRLRVPDGGRVYRLPRPWRMRTVVLISQSLRLLRADTWLLFDKSADAVAGDYRISEERSELFEADHIQVVSSANTDQLTRVHWLHGHEVERDSYDYPRDAVPLEIVGLDLSVAVERRVPRFDFDLLLPDGSTHGVRSIVHRTRDLTPFAKGYRLPRRYLHRDEEVAVIEMRLASPIKYLLFPHRFYMVYASAEPQRLLAIWGGDPEADDDRLQAFRTN